MDVYTVTDYKKALQERLKEQRKRGLPWSARRLALHLKLQPTYLSRIFHSVDQHLSEEDLWLAAHALDFLAPEIDFLLLLRASEVAKHARRRDELRARIQSLRDQRVLQTENRTMGSTALNNEMEFLFQPLAFVLYATLMSEKLRSDLRLVASRLGVRLPQLRELLKVLERNGLITLDQQDSLRVHKVQRRRPHFAKDHPLMRAHQAIFKQQIQARLQATPEEEKDSFLVTFSMDDAAFQATKREFQLFLQKVEKISLASKHTGVYQLSLDLFRWL